MLAVTRGPCHALPSGGPSGRRRRMARPRATDPGLGECLPSTKSCLYLDYNATTPVFPEVAAAIADAHWGNPSSGHVYGRSAQAIVKDARAAVARLVNAPSDDSVVFVSCGTEADNWAIWGTCMHARRQRGAGFVPHVVSCVTEHPAVLQFLVEMEGHGLLSYSLVGVDGEGFVSPADVEAAMRPETVLVSIMHGNNEVGTVQDVAAIARVAHSHGALLHCNAAQSIGKIPVDMAALNADMVTVVGHKFGAPKGVGALVVAPHVTVARMLCGGGQEGGRRAGTENVMMVAALGAAAKVVLREQAALTAHMEALRATLVDTLRANLGPAADRLLENGPADASRRLPNTASVSVLGLDAAALLSELGAGCAPDRPGVAAPAGAACHSADAKPSGVLAAMGYSVERMRGTMRLSVGRHTTWEEVVQAAGILARGVRQQLGLAE